MNGVGKDPEAMGSAASIIAPRPRHSQRRLSAALAGLLAWSARLGLRWLLLAPLAWLLPGISGYPYPGSGALFSDLAISHDPNAFFLRQALLQWRTVPAWSPLILSGAPFAADPLADLFYPPGWLALVLPLPLGFNLLAAAHLIFGGWGTYQLLRYESLSRESALFGGLTFAALPKLYAHFGAGHITLLMAVAWTPWLLLAQAQGGLHLPLGRRRFHIPPGVLLALIFLADVRWAAYASILWLSYAVFRSEFVFKKGWRTWMRSLGALLFQVLLAFLLAAPLALPLWEFVRHSARSAMQASDVLESSLPAARLLGLFFPDFSGAHEWMLYSGAGVLALTLLGLLWKSVRRETRFWWLAAGLALVYALGSAVPGLEYVARLPGFSLLRVPPRTLFILGLALAILASHSLDHLLKGPEGNEVRRAALLLVGMAGFILALAGGVTLLTGGFERSFIWGAGAWLLAAVALLLVLQRRVERRAWLLGWFILCLLDLGVVNHSLFHYRPAVEVQAEGQAAAAFLAAQPGHFRVYSPSYSLPQQTAARYGLELADGVNPLQLNRYVRFMERAGGVPAAGYSVTLPPFAGGHPDSDNRAYRPDPQLLGLLNVRYILAEFDLVVDGLEPVRRFGETRVYKNLYARPRAWLQSIADPEGIKPVEVISWRPNRIELQVHGSVAPATGDRRVILSEIYYPGWQVTLDGEPAEVQAELGLLRSVLTPPGDHRIVLVYRPTLLYWGLSLSVLGLILLLVRQRWIDSP